MQLWRLVVRSWGKQFKNFVSYSKVVANKWINLICAVWYYMCISQINQQFFLTKHYSLPVNTGSFFCRGEKKGLSAPLLMKRLCDSPWGGTTDGSHEKQRLVKCAGGLTELKQRIAALQVCPWGSAHAHTYKCSLCTLNNCPDVINTIINWVRILHPTPHPPLSSFSVFLPSCPSVVLVHLHLFPACSRPHTTYTQCTQTRQHAVCTQLEQDVET